MIRQDFMNFVEKVYKLSSEFAKDEDFKLNPKLEEPLILSL